MSGMSLNCKWMTFLCSLALASGTAGCSKKADDMSTDMSMDDAGMMMDDTPLERATKPLPKADPITAPDNEWTWVDFPKTRCMDDSPTGLGIKFRENSDKLLIVIQGGGACFNTLTCAAAANPNGFGESNLAANVGIGLLNADDADNPFRNWNMVFIPYCSGDIFSGAAENGTGFEGRTQMGYLNMREYLTRLVPTFKDASRVVLSGYSAGGFAASVNWVQAIEGWGDGVRVDVLNDSGPPLGEKYLTTCLQQRLAEVWNWSANIPDGCTECDISTGHVTEPVMRWSIAYTKKFRHGLISSSEDPVIKLFYSYGLNDCSGLDALFPPTYPTGLYPEGLQDLQDNIFADHPNAEAFIVDSTTTHTWTVQQSPGAVESEGVILRDWIKDFLDTKSDWQTVAPF